MIVKLSERKRQRIEARAKTSADDARIEKSPDNSSEIFRRHFEARFKPLPTVKRHVPIDEEQADDSEEEDSKEEDPDWSRLLDVREAEIQVVQHTDVAATAAMSKDELKKFLTSKIPKNHSESPKSHEKIQKPTADDLTESANLKKDLALQRLLAESYLLDSVNQHTASGKNRHKATDLRVQALGAKTSLMQQKKMPIAHRRGIVAKQIKEEDKRRREAQEKSVVLEKATIVKKKTVQARKGLTKERGIGHPVVGRFKGGMLSLSSRDLGEIMGPSRGGKRRRI